MKAKALTACLIFLITTTTLVRAEALNFNLSATASGFNENDTIPENFFFSEVTEWDAGLVASADAIISGIDVPAPASVSGNGDPRLSFTDITLVKNGLISNGDKLTVSLVPPDWESTYNATVTVGGKTADFTVKTRIQPVSITLADVGTISATQNQTFNLDFKTLATVTGGPKANPANASKMSWSIGNAESALPKWLSLDASTGILSGTPADKGSTSFEVVGTYLDTEGRRVYRIDVGGVVLEVAQISVGNLHACAVMTDGGVKCWGDGAYGKTGQGSTDDITVPTNVTTLGKNIRQVSAGGSHTCAVLTDDTAKCWGSGVYGQLGNDTKTTSYVPVIVSNLSNVDKIIAGAIHTCATLKSGGVKCWGNAGRVGDGSFSERTVPTSVSDINEVVRSIAASLQDGHTCVATISGAVKCWGWNAYGQIGNGTKTDVHSPYTVSNLGAKAIAVATTEGSSCAILENGKIKCWGWNDSGRLGNGTTSNSLTPVDVSGISGASAISGGQSHICAIDSSRLKCWGSNSSGQLGIGTSITKSTTPVSVVNLPENILTISAGTSSNCALVVSGGLKCWGNNSQGTVGDGTKVQKSSPVDITY
ncbi:putative Ig domain-containing protein [Ruixingdingia sedimenti]|uniref:Ig domain-containing protein n=1 Tax=Ruixingdingia sedimenti TaxID=3073604 RepID=A0ABU1FEP4_9RHOB|nr:putative Ig domain-containing protein [Xinfangfangia sp. LG-4]MDR5655331.1 putative Ig domain-containing protein [Xinfangfangia sp. LG-4]